MLIQQSVGPPTTTSSLSPNSQPNLRGGNMGDTIVSELQARYYEGTYRRSRFCAANSVGVTTTVGVATTYVGICLSNTPGNTVNLVLDKVGFSFLVAWTAAASIGLMTGFNATTAVTHSTPLTPKSSFISGTAGVGLVDSSATLPTAPTVDHIFGTGLTAAITTAPGLITSLIDLEGSIILPPGAYAAIFTSTASGASSFWGSMSWSEVPI